MFSCKIIKPNHPLLTSCIEHYMYVSGERQILSKRILPRPGASLILDFTAPFYCDDASFTKALGGFQYQPFTLTAGEKQTDHFVVQFTPCGLSRFTGIPMDELSGQIIEPGNLFGEDINRLHEQAHYADTPEQRVKLIEAFLLERYSIPDRADQAVVTIAEHLRRNFDRVDFEAVKKQSSYSTRQIERAFKSIIGADMQNYIRICRFDYAKNLLIKNPALRLTDVGLEAGYYDQPHFSKDFKRISGVRPRTFEYCMTP